MVLRCFGVPTDKAITSPTASWNPVTKGKNSHKVILQLQLCKAIQAKEGNLLSCSGIGKGKNMKKNVYSDQHCISKKRKVLSSTYDVTWLQ